MKRVYPVLASIAVLFIGVYISTTYHLYQHIWHFDKVMHFLGGYVAPWLIFAFFQKRFMALPARKRTWMLIGAAFAIGVIWEILEFISGHYLTTIAPTIHRYFYGGDAWDTATDLLFDLFGTLAYVLPRRNK